MGKIRYEFQKALAETPAHTSNYGELFRVPPFPGEIFLAL